MNILIQTKESSADSEIKEFTENNGNTVFISHTTNESILNLSNYTIDKAVVSLKNLKDAVILKYLNDYYPDIEVVVIANKALDDVLSIFQKVNYTIIHEPLKLSELKTKLNKNLNPI